MLEKLSKHHDLWIKMLVNLGCEVELAKDLVQEMYLRLDRLVEDEDRIMYNDSINRYFVYTTLRNMYFSHLTKKSKVTIYPLLESDDEEVSADEFEELLDENAYFRFMLDKVYDMLDGLHAYEKQLFRLHFIEGQSLRKISRESKVSLSSVHNSIKNQRRMIRALLLEDFEDYKNKDYNQM